VAPATAPETVLITGGAGTLGRTLAPLLLAKGSHVRLADIAPAHGPRGAEAMIGDLRDRRTVAKAMQGVDAVVHAAAWHGMHLREHLAQDFFDLNVAATFHVFEEAAIAGVARVVLASTMGVYGRSRQPGLDGRAVRVSEDLLLQPDDIYGASKVLAEELAAYYDRAREVRSLALRFGMFVPEPFLHTGIRFLYGGVDQRDVARAVIAALAALKDRTAGQFTAFNVESAVPYDDADAGPLREDPMAVIRRHWPDAPELLAAVHTGPWGPINEWFDISAAQRELGWKPRRGFGDFVDALRAGHRDWPAEQGGVAASTS
jgi:UDP-glucose 4-epimerase